MELLLGIHLGTCTSHALLADSTGRPVCSSSLPAAVLPQRQPYFGSVHLSQLLNDVADKAGFRLDELSSQCTLVFVGAPQGHVPTSRARALAYLEREGFGEASKGVGSEGELTLWAGIGSAVGIGVNSDITTTAHGRNSSGQRMDLGGWGIPLGADGSAFSVGLASIEAIKASLERRGLECRALTENVLQLLDIASVKDFLNILQRLDLNKRYLTFVSSLLPAIVRAAEADSDPVADAVLQQAGVQLAAMAIAVRDQLGFEDIQIPVVLSGPVIGSAPSAFAVAETRLREAEPRAATIRSPRPPVLGALLLAFRGLGKRVPLGLFQELSEWFALSNGSRGGDNPAPREWVP